MRKFLDFVVKVNENCLVYLFRHVQTALSLHPSTSPYILDIQIRADQSDSLLTR